MFYNTYKIYIYISNMIPLVSYSIPSVATTNACNISNISNTK